MPRIIQVRDVPDDVHAELSAAAEAQGLSMNKFVLRELEQVARRAPIAKENMAIVRRTQAAVGRYVARDKILSAIREGRDE